MREYRPEAWREFQARFWPLLEHVADRCHIPESERDDCIDEVLNEEMVRLTDRKTVPTNLSGYLATALWHRWLKMRRAHDRRQRVYREAANTPGAKRPIVRALVSEATLRASADPSTDEGTRSVSPAIARWIRLLRAHLSTEEFELLQWAGDLTPRPLMAKWLGTSYDAARKRVARTIEHARALARVCEQQLSPEDQIHVRRILRRAGVLPGDDSKGRHGSGEA
jgi:hypothetical protein